MFRRFLASALSVLLSLGSITAALPAAAADVTENEIYLVTELPTGDLEEPALFETEAGAEPAAETGELRLMAAQQTADTGISKADPLFAQTSTSYGYNDLALRNNGASRQKLYKDLLTVCEKFWNSTADLKSSEIDLHYSDGSVVTTTYYPLAEINVSSYKMSIDDVDETFFTFRNDHPLFYFCSSTVFRSRLDDYAYSVTPTVDAEFAKGSTRKSLQSKITTFISSYSAVASQKTKYGIADAIRTKLNDSMEYAYKSDGKTPEDAGWAHCIIGAITKQKGVCESYAKTFQLLCNYYGVDCLMILGTANGGNHAWNTAKMDNGKYYLFDLTWNDVRQSQYFAWGTKAFNSDHSPFLPTGTAQYFLYALPSIPSANFDTSNLSQYNHTHSYASGVYYNSDYHSNKCSCGYTTYSAHTKAAAVRENVKSASCTSAGSYDSVVYCKGCGAELSRTTVTVSPTGHTSGTAVKENEKAPSCTEAGSYELVVRCTGCGTELSRSTVPVPAAGHTPGEPVKENESAPDCTNKGSYEEVVRCTECGEEISRETRETDALGHSWDEGEVLEAADCTTGGLLRHSCTRCHETEEITTEALGHDWDEGEITEEPDCENGGTKIHSCSRCTEKLEETLDPLGHDWGEGEETAKADCLNAGNMHYECSRCTAVKDEVILALGHNYEDTVTDPTCTEGGYTTHTCSRCTDSYTDSETEPLGHNYVSTVVPPTTEAEGYTHHACTRCTDAYDDTIVPKLIPISSAKISLKYTAFTYTGKQIDVAKYLTVTYDGRTLVNGTDYELSYENGVDVGYKTCTLTITGVGLFGGAVEKQLTIKPVKLAAPTLSTKNGAIIVSWKRVTSDALGYQIIYDKVADFDTSASGHTEDYHTTTVTDLDTLTKTLSAYTKPGETWYVKVRAFITSDGTVKGTRYGTFSAAKKIVVKGNLSSASIPYSSYTYSGKAIKPTVTVKDTKGTKLTADDYTVTYANNTKIGKATITITGRGSYQGTLTKTFMVKPVKNAITSLTSSAKNTFTVTYKKADAGTVGYQIVYAKDKNFTVDYHSTTVTSLSTLSKKVSSNVKSGETWYVKVRSFVTADGKTTSTRYGNYSDVKSVKIK